MHAPAPKATGQRAGRARGGGPGHGERGARGERKRSLFFSMELPLVPGTAAAGQGTRGHRRHPGDSPEWTRTDGQMTGAANKERGSGAGLTAEPGSARPPQRDARPRAPARARAPLRVTFLLHLEQQLFFPFPSPPPPPLPLLSSRFIPACSSSHSLPPSAILQACDVGSRSPLTHI